MTMVFCLSAGSLAEIDLKRLAGLAKQIRINIRNSYDIKLMYAVAASIPKDEKGVSYDLSRVTPNEQTKWNDGILSTLRLVVAQIKRVTTKKGSQYTQHAEWRVLQNVRCLEGHNGDFFGLLLSCQSM